MNSEHLCLIISTFANSEGINEMEHIVYTVCKLKVKKSSDESIHSYLKLKPDTFRYVQWTIPS